MKTFIEVQCDKGKSYLLNLSHIQLIEPSELKPNHSVIHFAVGNLRDIVVVNENYDVLRERINDLNS